MNTIKIIIFVALAILCIILLWYYIKKHSLEQIRADVYKAILYAENHYRHTVDNEKKLNYVIGIALDALPKWARPFITRTLVISVVQHWYVGVKDLLDDGKFNCSQNVGV